MHYRFESAPFFELIPASMNTESPLEWLACQWLIGADMNSL
jgi:hypothetical protein